MFFFISCNKKQNIDKFYRAVSYDKKDTAYLKLSEIDNQFIGKYLVIYSNKNLDLENISGEIIEDTLKGKNKYVSRRNSKFTKPFVLLKENENFKLGTGMFSYFSQIPFFADGTLQFPDSLFQFSLIESIKIVHLKEKLQF